MIILTEVVENKEYYFNSSHRFMLSIKQGNNEEVIINEMIPYPMIVNYVATFRFADEKGNLYGSHVAGFFGNKDNLPIEIKNGVKVKDLTEKQKLNYLYSMRKFEVNY